MSGRLLRLACTAAVTVSAGLAPAPSVAAPDPGTTPAAQPGPRPLSELLTDLQKHYRETEQATEVYNATTEKLKKQQDEVERLDGELARTRLALQASRGEVGRLARQQYQSSTHISAYVRLLLARDPQHALDEGHVIGQLARERAESVQRLVGTEQQADAQARRARKALDDQLTLADRQKEARDDVERQLRDVEKLLSALTPEELAALSAFEKSQTAAAQDTFVSSGSLGAPGVAAMP
ncbi:hypothetical protein [Streptomyces sp. MI02-2A]|uniref:coiled-coil domain-containing protein n=1 Tax=Streptomyces sp. MI02-2A TaxID=3028688 RepID=UPI0029C0348A|nr:hypothetical protein [Streptomyces sp. MI02-2A]